MRLFIFFFIAVFFFCVAQYSNAQDILGGELIVTETDPSFTTIKVDIYSQGGYRDTMLIDWGDGATDTLDFFGSGGALGDVYLTSYIAEHTYPDTGVYVITVKDSFWVDGIVNIPNSGEKSLLLQDTLVIDSNLLYEGPDIIGTHLGIDYSEDGVLSHNLGVSFMGPIDELIFKQIAVPVPGYTFPEAPNFMGFEDPTVGIFTWDKPQETGRFAVAFRLYVWYDGRIMSTTTRQMTIQVDSIFSGLTYTTLGGELFSSFPNPANDVVYIDFENPTTASTTLQITNSLGAVVVAYELPTGTSSRQLDVGHLPAGVYHVSVAEQPGRRLVKW